MFAISARRLGYRVHTFSPDTDTPTGQISDVEIVAAYEDIDAVKDFARHVDVVTFEFENVSSATAEACETLVPVRPTGAVLHTTQHRLREKLFLQENGFPCAPFRAIESEAELIAVVDELGCPCILKTAGFGYDGKGQVRITAPEQAKGAWHKIGAVQGVLEAFIDFECEVSVVAARAMNGEFAHYGVVRNDHRNHILDVTTSPSGVDPRIERRAIEIARGVLECLQVIGVLAVEFFVTRSGELLINELAPRPHNSGHWTIDACVTSQFEQQLRAVCGLPLGSTEALRPAAMANLLGDLWTAQEPDWASALSLPTVKLHLYGKVEPRPGRKMGHLTAVAATAEQARAMVLDARHRLVTGD